MNLRGRLRSMIAPQPDKNGAEAKAALDVARYKYLLRVSSPQVFDRLHTEAFAQLSVDTREALFRRLCHDLSDERRPTSAYPAELARAAAWAQDDDPVYLLRVLRRPAPEAATMSQSPARKHPPHATLYGASVLQTVARMAAASPAATETLLGFDTSLEAAQVNPTHYVPRRGGGADHGPPSAEWLP